MAAITLEQTFETAREHVYAALADQDRMGEWLGGPIRVVKRGPNGVVGTVRRIGIGVAAIDEQIITAEPPSAITYRIVSTVPLLRHHEGRLDVEALGPRRSKVTWHIVLDFKVPGLASIVLARLKLKLSSGLSRLAEKLRST